MSMERRRARRYQFVADADVLDVESGAHWKTKTGDLSIGGCFVNSRNPIPEGTDLRVTISYAGRDFTAQGRVVFAFPKLGMGLMFTEVSANELPTLVAWLTELERRPAAGLALAYSAHRENKA